MRTSRYAKNKHTLAARIGLSRPALARLFKRGDYPPITNHGWVVDQWQRYADENIATWNRRDPKTGSNGSTPHVNPRDAAFIRRQELAAERDKISIDKERRELLKRTEVNETISTANALVRRELYKAIEHDLPPRLEGMPALEIKKTLRKRLDQILHGLPKTFDQNGL